VRHKELLIEIYKSIKIEAPKKQFLMPLSLRYIKELAAVGIDWHNIHIIDLTSLVYSIRIDNARQKIEYDRRKRMADKGIQEVQTASEADFDAL
jgi:hypothetical protein